MFEPSFQAQLLSSSERKRIKHSQLCLSEIMTIITYFHHSSYRNFKHYYQYHISTYHRQDFPYLVSYKINN
ncbi:hypothetical protein [Geminocystis sp. GBBB08]|uniref:hypothetical protein n=1 Tax=Geminocystis sp. GBBB08 TaxID=2604140 RepID=UPI0027E30D5F|nr:hypothetical protein [Geminocystis sp. GBBB08]